MAVKAGTPESMCGGWATADGEYVGVGQSLPATCRLQDVDPSMGLVDVVQRVDIHPFAEFARLTP